MTQNSDDSIEIELEITHHMEIKPLVLYYMPHIRVIEPSALADEIDDALREYLNGASN